jgi:SAM-dependent methyltransferase
MGLFLASRKPSNALASYREHDEELWVVRNLVALAARRQGREVRFLDFGAGGATACKTAKALGVADVFAYDPFYAGYIQDVFERVHGFGITALRQREQVLASAPFDAVLFQSSVEHVADPKLELATIRDAMTSGGFLYVNNPFLDLARDLDRLKAATKIAKKDRISHYHPWHLNYLTPRQFRSLLDGLGFRVTNLAFYAPPPPAAWLWRERLRQAAKTVVRTSQNALRLPYDRYVFIAEKR